ncbi:MAG: hypothetical protein AAFZ02_01495 [Pseudomonadota bacterium]
MKRFVPSVRRIRAMPDLPPGRAYWEELSVRRLASAVAKKGKAALCPTALPQSGLALALFRGNP